MSLLAPMSSLPFLDLVIAATTVKVPQACTQFILLKRLEDTERNLLHSFTTSLVDPCTALFDLPLLNHPSAQEPRPKA